MRRYLGSGVAGGVLAGALVGAAEALAAWWHAHGAGEMPAVAWALGVYGAMGGVLGVGAAGAAAVLGTDAFALAFAGTAMSLGVVVARFRIIRDVFLEQLPHGPIANLVQGGALACAIALGVALWWVLRGVGRSSFARPLVAVIVVAVVAAASKGATRLVPAPSGPVATGERPAAKPGVPNVILIVVDTLRADHLGAWGYRAARTPRIDGLAGDGIRFANTFSQASWTRPSIATILTGMYPSSHGAIHKADSLPDRVDTLAETLTQAGYQTVGFADNANISPAFNFGQGFSEYHYLAPSLFFFADEVAGQLTLYSGLRLVRERFLSRSVAVDNYYQPAEVVTDKAVRWIAARRQGQGPFFLFVHYMDPHDPYFVHPFNGEGYARVVDPDPPVAVADRYRQLYDGEIAYLDQQLGRLFDDLRQRGLYEGTLIALTADHGEEFQEHGGWWHGTTLYDEQIHVPLIIKPAGGAGRGRVVEDLATSLDIAPTIAATAHAVIPPTMVGHVLAAEASVGPAGYEQVFAEEDLEGNVLQSVRTKTWKLVSANPGNPRGLHPEELYDVAADPGERRDVRATATGELETMRAALGRATLEARAHAGAGQQGEVDAVTQERLRALGYVN